MKKIHAIAIGGCVWFVLTGLASGATVVPLNTGYNHVTGSVYPLGARDDYWINIASSLPTSPAADRTFTVPQVTCCWQPPMPGSTWIAPRNTSSSNLDPLTKTGYTLFRKCFCMMSFSQAQISFKGRADDTIQVWLNTHLNQLVAPSPGQFGSATPFQGGTNDQSKFRVGPNCLYVLDEDAGGQIGLNLTGTISAFGLLPMPASSTSGGNVSFPCGCNFAAGPAAQQGMSTDRAAAQFDDREVVQQIVKIAEARAAARAARGKTR